MILDFFLFLNFFSIVLVLFRFFNLITRIFVFLFPWYTFLNLSNFSTPLCYQSLFLFVLQTFTAQSLRKHENLILP